MRRAAQLRAAILVAVLVTSARTAAQPPGGPPPRGSELALLAPAAEDDARSAIAIGPAGEVYRPDGQGAWIRRQQIATSDTLATAGRVGAAVFASGDRVVYRLAPNGWTAIRRHQKDRAVISGGLRAVAAVGRQLFTLDPDGGEPQKLASAPRKVLAIRAAPDGAARAARGAKNPGIVVLTDRGLFKLQGSKFVAVKNAPRKPVRLVSDRWVLLEDGAVDLETGRKTAWPTGIEVAPSAAFATADGRLVVAATEGTKLVLVTVTKDKLAREPVEASTAGADAGSAGMTPVAVVTDRAHRVVLALRDGRVLLRERGAWTSTQVRSDLPAPRPGAPPARSQSR